RSEAADLHRRILELLPHLTPRSRRERNLDAVLVGRPQLDRLEAGLAQILDEGRYVPILGDVVGDRTKFQATCFGGRAQARIEPECRERGRGHEAAEELASSHRDKLTGSLPLQGLHPQRSLSLLNAFHMLRHTRSHLTVSEGGA